jgi:predicted DNA binding CopG/RHH family protein
MKKMIPEFKSEAEEFEFWSPSGEGADSTEFLDWSQAKRTKLPNLKPSLRTISVRLPVAMIEDLKILANKRDVPYQSLLKVFLAERLEVERGLRRAVIPSIEHEGGETATNSQYDYATLSAIWGKAQVVQGYDANVYRKDSYGSWIAWNEYGQTTQSGWEVDHIVADAPGGSSALSNLQPVHWKNSREKRQVVVVNLKGLQLEAKS